MESSLLLENKIAFLEDQLRIKVQMIETLKKDAINAISQSQELLMTVNELKKKNKQLLKENKEYFQRSIRTRSQKSNLLESNSSLIENAIDHGNLSSVLSENQDLQNLRSFLSEKEETLQILGEELTKERDSNRKWQLFFDNAFDILLPTEEERIPSLFLAALVKLSNKPQLFSTSTQTSESFQKNFTHSLDLSQNITENLTKSNKIISSPNSHILLSSSNNHNDNTSIHFIDDQKSSLIINSESDIKSEIPTEAVADLFISDFSSVPTLTESMTLEDPQSSPVSNNNPSKSQFSTFSINSKNSNNENNNKSKKKEMFSKEALQIFEQEINQSLHPVNFSQAPLNMNSDLSISSIIREHNELWKEESKLDCS